MCNFGVKYAFDNGELLKMKVKCLLSIIVATVVSSFYFSSCYNGNNSTGNDDVTIERGDSSSVGNVKEFSEGLEYSLIEGGIGYSVIGMGGCTDTEIIIPSIYNGLPVLQIGKRAFDEQIEIKSVIIPDSVISIEDEAFWECYALAELTIGLNVNSIGAYAFCWEYSLTSVIFKNTRGWKVAREENATDWTDVPESDLSDGGIAATHLKLTYYQYYWQRN